MANFKEFIQKYYFYLLLLIAVIAVSLKIKLFKTVDIDPDRCIAFCNAERLINQGDNLIFMNEGLIFQNAFTQSNERSFSGQFSSKLTYENRFGMLFFFDFLLPGKSYEISVWRLIKPGDGDGVLVADCSWKYYKNTSKPIENSLNGWEKLCLIILVPDTVTQGKITIYPWLSWGTLAYFDDLKIKEIVSPKN